MVAHSLPGIYTQYLVELVKRWGVTADELLAGSGVVAESLTDPQLRIPIDIAARHLERARTLTREPALGFFLGTQMRLAAPSRGGTRGVDHPGGACGFRKYARRRAAFRPCQPLANRMGDDGPAHPGLCGPRASGAGLLWAAASVGIPRALQPARAPASHRRRSARFAVHHGRPHRAAARPRRM